MITTQLPPLVVEPMRRSGDRLPVVQADRYLLTACVCDEGCVFVGAFASECFDKGCRLQTKDVC